MFIMTWPVWTMLFIGGSVLPTLCDAARDGMNRKYIYLQIFQLLALIWIMVLLKFVMRISVRRLIRRRLSVFTNPISSLPSSYRANVVYPIICTSYPSPDSEPSDDIPHSYVDDADLNIAQPVNSFGVQESTSQNSNSELVIIIRESTVQVVVAVGGDRAPMEEDSNGGGPEGEKGIDMHDCLVVETGVHYQCSGTIKSFNAGVEFCDAAPLVFEEGEEDDDGGGDGGDDDNGGVFVATKECTISEDDLEEVSEEN